MKTLPMIWIALVLLLLAANFDVFIAAHPEGPGVAGTVFFQMMVAHLTRRLMKRPQ